MKTLRRRKYLKQQKSIRHQDSRWKAVRARYRRMKYMCELWEDVKNRTFNTWKETQPRYQEACQQLWGLVRRKYAGLVHKIHESELPTAQEATLMKQKAWDDIKLKNVNQKEAIFLGKLNKDRNNQLSGRLKIKDSQIKYFASPQDQKKMAYIYDSILDENNPGWKMQKKLFFNNWLYTTEEFEAIKLQYRKDAELQRHNFLRNYMVHSLMRHQQKHPPGSTLQK